MPNPAADPISSSWIFSPSAPPPSAPGELITDYRSRIALERFQAAERRHQRLAEQSSARNTPEMRIRIWEDVHGLRLPKDPAHPVLRAVAMATELTLEQVHEEQRQRSEHANRPVSVPERDQTPPAAS